MGVPAASVIRAQGDPGLVPLGTVREVRWCCSRPARNPRVVEHIRAEVAQARLGGEAEVALPVQPAGHRSGRQRGVVVAVATPKMSSIVRSQL